MFRQMSKLQQYKLMICHYTPALLLRNFQQLYVEVFNDYINDNRRLVIHQRNDIVSYIRSFYTSYNCLVYTLTYFNGDKGYTYV